MTSPYIQQAVARCKLPVRVYMTGVSLGDAWNPYWVIDSGHVNSAYANVTAARYAYLAALQAYRVAEDDRGLITDMEV